MNKIKERLREIRNRENLKQSEVAQILNISTTCYAGYEQGYREPNADMIIKICNYFDITTDYLLGLEDENGIREIEKTSQIHTDNRSYYLKNINKSKIDIK